MPFSKKYLTVVHKFTLPIEEVVFRKEQKTNIKSHCIKMRSSFCTIPEWCVYLCVFTCMLRIWKRKSILLGDINCSAVFLCFECLWIRFHRICFALLLPAAAPIVFFYLFEPSPLSLLVSLSSYASTHSLTHSRSHSACYLRSLIPAIKRLLFVSSNINSLPLLH